MDIARLDCNFQENQMVPLLQREALLKYCPEQYRNSNTKYQESVRLILEYWQCNITIALQVLGYLYCNIGIACLLNWNFINWYITRKNFNKKIGSSLRIALPSTGSWVFTECSQPSETSIESGQLKSNGNPTKTNSTRIKCMDGYILYHPIFPHEMHVQGDFFDWSHPEKF